MKAANIKLYWETCIFPVGFKYCLNSGLFYLEFFLIRI